MNPQGAPGLILSQDISPGAVKQIHLVPGNVQTGQMYYGLYGGNFTNLNIGTTGQILMVVKGVPTWTTFPQSGVAANRPTSGRFTGDQYLATDTLAFSVWTGAAWKSTTLS